MWYLIRLACTICHVEVFLSLPFSLSKPHCSVVLNKDDVECLVLWLCKVGQMVDSFYYGPGIRRSLAVRVLERVMCTLELTPYLGLFLLVCWDRLWWVGRAALIGKVRNGFRTRMSSESALWGKEVTVIMRLGVSTYVLSTVTGCFVWRWAAYVCCGVSSVIGRLRWF
jgi:hypothetical protein